MHGERAAPPFQVCGACRQAWPTWDAFVRDPGVELLGLQAAVETPEANLLVFEHRCGTSISVLTRRMRHLLPEPEPGEPAGRLLGSEQCRGHCRRLPDLEACDAPCSNARERRLIQLVLQMRRA